MELILVGVSWLLYWFLTSVFTVALDKAVLIVALVFILLGLFIEYYGHRHA